ncbi:hypothetical protein ACFYUD_32190 [Nocardia tengchongensis]|uniref:hypothetical protein n=1 Tax=Nocardia tengchongensis TaxID=2055889 RepID=UPI0036B5A0FD
MFIHLYQLTSWQAFQLLRWRSQETGIKALALAERLLAELSTVSPAQALTRFDHLLLTLDEHIHADRALLIAPEDANTEQ